MKFLYDFFPILLFFIAYKLQGIYVATAVAIIASCVQVAFTWLKHKRVEKMHVVTLALIVILGGATLLFQDKAFFMWKPTAVNWLFAAAFLGSHFIGEKTVVERMMGNAIKVPASIWPRLNISWVLFFILMGMANLLVANYYFVAESALFTHLGHPIELDQCNSLAGQARVLCDHAREMEEDWVNFKLFGMMGLTFVFVIAQGFYLAKHMQHEDTSDTAANDSEQAKVES